MHEAARILRARSQRYAVLMAEEMGKPVRDGRAEAEKCAWVCEYYAERAESFLAPEPVETDATRSLVFFQPLGVILAIMPWNFPLWQVFRFLAPALMAGNAGVLKHAANVPGCALAIEELCRDAGFPEGLFRSLLIPNSRVRGVLRNPCRPSRSPGAPARAGRWRARPARSSRSACSSWEEATRTWCSTTRISRRPSRPA
jgi:succinate-semialdehyde dehydrogenase/glutarate-semialdehyde dehydrogenase